MKPTVRSAPVVVRRHPLPLVLLVGLVGLAAGLAAGPAAARGVEPPAEAAAPGAVAATPTANARVVVGGPPVGAPAIDPVTARVRDHAARPLGGRPSGSLGDGPADESASASTAAPAAAPAAGRTVAVSGGEPEPASVLPPDVGAFGGAGELLRVGAALGVVLAIALILSRTVKRLGGSVRAGRPAGVLEIMARYPVGRGQQLVVVRMDRRLLLVHQGGGRMEPLSEITHPDEVASLIGRLEAGASGSDADRFRRTLAEFEHGRGPAGLRPDGTLDDPLRRPRRAGSSLGLPEGGASVVEVPGGPGSRASGLAAAIRAGRRRAAYGAARLGGDDRSSRAAHDTPGFPEEASRRPQVEIVDLTRNGARGVRGGRR